MPSATSLDRALALADDALASLGDAATILRDENMEDDLVYEAIRLEAHTAILSVHIQRAIREAERDSRAPGGPHTMHNGACAAVRTALCGFVA